MSFEKQDMINRPPHYTVGKIEPIDVIEDWGLGFHAATALKYLARYRHKGSPVEDLRKCEWYVRRLIEFEEKRKGVAGAEEGR